MADTGREVDCAIAGQWVWQDGLRTGPEVTGLDGLASGTLTRTWPDGGQRVSRGQNAEPATFTLNGVARTGAVGDESGAALQPGTCDDPDVC